MHPGDPEDRAEALHLQPVNRRLLDYWCSKLEAGRLPDKDRIDPRELSELLPDLVIYERIAPDHVRVRVIGTRVTARIGVDPTGGNIFELFAQRFKTSVMQAMNRVLDEPCLQITTVRDRFPSGRETLVEVIRLPLVDASGRPRFIISSTAELRPLGYRTADAAAKASAAESPTAAASTGEAPETVAEPLENRFVSLGELLARGAGDAQDTASA